MKIIEKKYLRLSGKSHVLVSPENKTKTAHHYDTILTVKIFEKDFHMSSYVKPLVTRKIKYSKRGTIKKLTVRSTKRLRFLLRNTAHKMEYEVGLTYPKSFSSDGVLVKKHFHKLRTRLNYYGYKYIWILEFQSRGAPHFHMLVSKEIKKDVLAKMWFDIVGSGDLKHLRRGVHVAIIRNKDGMAGYFATYLSKQDQKHVPESYSNVGRFWGSSKDLVDCTVKKFYGLHADIQELKREIRPLRRWYDKQKKSWSKKKKFVPIKNKFKSPVMNKGMSLKVINSDRYVYELRKRRLDFSLYES